MELKEYQSRALDAFVRWREALENARQESAAVVAAWPTAGGEIPAAVYNYPEKAWKALAEAGEVAHVDAAYVARSDGANRPIPHICFKVPTGGGKTLLAAAALERLNRPTGLTIWIVPTHAIFQQTQAALWSREHPYRQMLERASGGRVKMLKKDDRFTAGDLANYLCVMLLMLPAANRNKDKEFLRMFRDSARYPTLFPDSDDVLADQRLLNEYPDLERHYDGGPVKQSLFNVFKMQRPVVVLDEAHRAYGTSDAASEFVKSVNRLNPSMVIELSATPNPSNRRISNLLVDISGTDLKDEEMIKLPVQVVSYRGNDWQHTLFEAADELDRLQTEARLLQGGTNRYIRPIAVVRVERTGKDQRDGERIHADDVRDYLLRNLNVPAEAIREKSAEKDELGHDDLLSELSPVRWIITKAALMEGWDCPFAYMLVMLDNTRTQTAITQLMGRVMRMPHTRRTGREPLDRCYVYCWNADVGDVVEQVKNGLEEQGLTGLGDEVWSKQSAVQPVLILRREPFRNKTIFLPRVLHEDGVGGWCELDYERHILPEVAWERIGAPDPQAAQPDPAKRETASVDVGGVQPSYGAPQDLHIDKALSVEWFARRLADVVPNPWQAARVASELLGRLQAAGLRGDEVYDQRSRQASALRSHVASEIEAQAEATFRRKLANGQIRFDLEAGEANYRLAERYDLSVGEDEPTLQRYGRQLTMNLYEPLFTKQFDSDLERKFAFYLDEQKAVRWWHRVAARQRNEYYLRGWRRDRIFPDFVAFGNVYDELELLLIETKGDHLAGNTNTEYKKRVFEVLESAFNGRNDGRMVLREGEARGIFRLVFNEAQFAEVLPSSYVPMA